MRSHLTKITAWAGAACLFTGSDALAAEQIVAGKAKVEVYEGFAGVALADLTNHVSYPNNPTRVYYVDSLEFPDAVNFPDPADPTRPRSDALGNYGIRISGFLTPRQTGEYIFYLAADDNGGFWLSPDENPDNAVPIAREPAWNPVRDFLSSNRRTCLLPDATGFVKCDNVSNPIRLEAGKRYAYYGLMKEAGGGDNFAVTWTPKGTPLNEIAEPIPAEFLSTKATDAVRILTHPKNAATYAGRSVTFSAAVEAPPGTTASFEWLKDGSAISGAASATLSFAATAADHNARIKVRATAGASSADSNEATLSVFPDEADVLSPGFLKIEFFKGITGTAISALTDSPKYQQNAPDEVRYTASFQSPNGYGDNYGARISGFIIPAQSGEHRFFIRSDNASQLFLSADDNPNSATLICEESGCCAAFMNPGSEETSEPVNLQAGRRYAIYALLKEGSGGDYVQVAWRRESDATPPAQLTPISGTVLGTMAEPAGLAVSVTENPANVSVIEGRSATFLAKGVAAPVVFDYPVRYQWKKNGSEIAGAVTDTLSLKNLTVADNGAKISADIYTLANVRVTTAEATLTVLPDTFPPGIASLGNVRKGSIVEIGLLFDEAVDPVSAGAQANYALSAGTVSAVRYVKADGGVVIAARGLTAGSDVAVTVRNVKDVKDNAITTPVTKTTKIQSKLSWVGIGGDEINAEKNSTAYRDDVVAWGEKNFDLISGGSAHWDSYDEQTFVYEEVTGDFDKMVRVEYQDATSQWARAGLNVREALDEGLQRGGLPFSQSFSMRVNPVTRADGGPGNNGYETIDRQTEGGVYVSTPGGGGAVPPYPNAWIRIKREGNTMTAYRSSDGKNWIENGRRAYTDNPDTPEDETWTQKVYVGMFYAPEYNNNNTKNILNGSSMARFRDYGDYTPVPSGARFSKIQLQGAQIVVEWTGSGVVQSADNVQGPYTDVPNAVSPLRVTPSGTAKFYRFKP